MFQKLVENITCANCGKKAKTGAEFTGMDMFGKVWENSAFGFNCAQELFGVTKKVIMQVAAGLAMKETERLKAEGWQQADFARNLKEML